MTATYLGYLVSRMPIARANLAQILTWHAVQPIDRRAALPRRQKNVKEGSPVVSPIQIKTNSLSKFTFVDLSVQPFVDDVLVPGKNRLYSEHQRPAMQRRLAQQRSNITLRCRQRVVVADQGDVSLADFFVDIFRRQNSLIRAESLAKVAHIFARKRIVIGTNFALHAGHRVELSDAASRS